MAKTGHPTDQELIRVVEGNPFPSTVDHLHDCYACATLVRGFVQDFFEPEDPFQATVRSSGQFPAQIPVGAGR